MRAEANRQSAFLACIVFNSCSIYIDTCNYNAAEKIVASPLGRVHIMVNFILISIAFLLISILLIANWVVRRTRRSLSNRSSAAQLRRGAGHMYKIARTAKMYTAHDAIARLLVQETARVLELAVKLDPDHLSTRNALSECEEMLASFNKAKRDSDVGDKVEYPESELLLLEAQMHLTEALRLLGGMGKRGLISHNLHQAIVTTLRHAQRSLESRLNLLQASSALHIEHRSDVDPQNLVDHLQPTFGH